jgi:hypothetical protein
MKFDIAPTRIFAPASSSIVDPLASTTYIMRRFVAFCGVQGDLVPPDDVPPGFPGAAGAPEGPTLDMLPEEGSCCNGAKYPFTGSLHAVKLKADASKSIPFKLYLTIKHSPIMTDTDFSPCPHGEMN